MIKIRMKYYATLAILFAILTTAFVYMYVRNESPVYIYDYSGYHETYKGFSKILKESPGKFKKEVVDSVRLLDYNCTPILLLIPFYLKFGASRFGYILGSCLMYVIPTIILSIVIMRRMLFFDSDKQEEEQPIFRIPLFFATIEIFGKGKRRTIFTIFICIASFLYTRWWSPTLRGLPDIIAVIPILSATIICLRHNFTDKKITVKDIHYLFYGCSSLVSVSGLSQLDISKCTGISCQFEKFISLENINDISQWDTKNIINAFRIFAECPNLKIFARYI